MCPTPGHPGTAGARATGRAEPSPLLPKHLWVQKPPASPHLDSTLRVLKSLQVMGLFQCSEGNTSCLVSALCLTGRSEQRAQVPINAHKVHECRGVSSLPLRLAQPGTGRCCAVLHPPTRDQPSQCQDPSPVQEPAGPHPCHHPQGRTSHVAGPVLLSM